MHINQILETIQNAKSTKNGQHFRRLGWNAAQVSFHGSTTEYTFFIPPHLEPLSHDDIVVVALRKINPTLALGQVRQVVLNSAIVLGSYDYDAILAKVDLGLDGYLRLHQDINLLP